MSNDPAAIAYIAGVRDTRRMELEEVLRAASAPITQAAMQLATQTISQGSLVDADIQVFAKTFQSEITRITEAAYMYGAMDATHRAFTTFDVRKQPTPPATLEAGKD